MPVAKGNENVFMDCGPPLAEAEILRMRAETIVALSSYIQERKLSQASAPRSWSFAAPNFGRSGSFTLGTLVNMPTSAASR